MLTKELNYYIAAALTLIIIISLLPFLPYLILALVAAFLLLVYRKDFAILLVIVLLIALTNYAFKGIRSVTNVIAVATLFYLFLKQYGLKYWEYPAIPIQFFYFILIFAFSLCISTLFSSSILLGLFNILRTAGFFLICYIFYSLIKSKKTIYLYIGGMVLAELAISISIYHDFLAAGLSFHLDNGILARFAGIYSNPNYMGYFVFIVTSFILSFYFMERFSSKILRVVISFLLLNSILIFIITDSRAAGIALMISSIFILSFLNRKLLKKLLLFGLPFLLILFLIPTIQNIFMILLRISEGSRVSLWEAGITMFGDHFFTGVGPQMYRHLATTYTPLSYIMLTIIKGQLYQGVPNPHNFFLLMASENGIFGLIAAVLLFATLFYFAYKCIRGFKNYDKEFYILSITIFGIILGVLENSFFEVSGILSYGYVTNDLPFWIVIIIVLYMYKKLTSQNISADNISKVKN